ncbi:hypothetical protein TIFTF001_004101 [Ficus carica]|uniref:Uncharacterized protein n=1 Tax=Ficus carica TaxID=3494 RepID=A0AA88CSN8_FICCA|nr:hypothetical protein TIFTF001_004101 [Ficus carica]
MVHAKALLKALAEELPKDAIKLSCGITSLEEVDEAPNKGTSIAIIHMEDGTTIKAKAIGEQILLMLHQLKFRALDNE